jgi:putative phosphotransacetylase
MSKQILVETSARHVHLSIADLKTLFGAEAALTIKKELSQPGQYASNERVHVVGPKNTISNVIILGPVRKETQVEISMTDARTLGITPIIRESGDIAGSSGCKIVGPKGEINITQGVIIAKRHIHAHPNEAKELGIKDKDIVWVRVNTPQRSIVLGDVVVRVREDFALSMHIDTDEANAGAIEPNSFGEIIRL